MLLGIRGCALFSGVEVGSPALTSFRGRSFHPSVALHARRILPHLNNMDGFFVCKLRKLSNQSPVRAKKDRSKTNPYVKVISASVLTCLVCIFL